MSHIIVIDIGTSSVKAFMFDRVGTITAEAETPYSTATYSDGRQEQAPGDWIDGALKAVQALSPEDKTIEMMVLSGTMQSVIPVDGHGTSLAPAILYSDGRATRELADLKSVFDACTDNLGNPPNEFMSAFKIAWLRRHDPVTFARTKTFHSGAKDVLAQWLTGCAVTDPTAASTVGLMDIDTWQWNRQLLTALQLSEHQLPTIMAADAIVGALLPGPAAALGLQAGIPVMNGAGDAGASTLGAIPGGNGATYVYVGTTAWVAQIPKRSVRSATPSHSIFTLAHPTDRTRKIRIGAMLSGGDSAAWLADTFATSLSELDARLAARKTDPSTTMFLPYLKGERCPFVDSHVRAAFVGLSRADDAADFHHAVIEGIALAIRANADALGDVVGDVLLLGGGALSSHLPQILANCLERPIAVADAPASVTALGCFRLGAKALGWADVRTATASRIMPQAGSQHHVRSRLALFERATSMMRDLASGP